jgi:hypothetical protein
MSLYFKKIIETDIDLMRAYLHDVLWNFRYHERELIKGGKRRAAAVALLARCNCNFTVEEAKEFYEECNTDDDELTDGDELLKFQIGSMADNHYHEEELRKASEQFTAAKIMIERGRYTEISIDEIYAEVEERLNK